MNARRVIVASTGLLVMLVVAFLFAGMSRFGAIQRAAVWHRRKLVFAAALTVAVVVTWSVLSPLAAAAVPLLFTAGAVAMAPAEPDDLADYASSSRGRCADEPSWWPEFERQFRRECRRAERIHRRSDRPLRPLRRRG